MIRNIQRGIGRRITGKSSWNPTGLENRLTHVDRGLANTSIGQFQIDFENSAPGLNLKRRLSDQAVVMDVLGYAAKAIAAHLGLAAVGVEHAHAGVGSFSGAN